MILDKEIDRRMLLQMIDASTFPGALAEEAVRLKQAVKSAPSIESMEKASGNKKVELRSVPPEGGKTDGV